MRVRLGKQVLPERVVLRIERRSAAFSEASRQELEDKLLGLMGKDIQLEWRFDEPFQQVPTGKHIYFLSRVQTPGAQASCGANHAPGI